MKRTVFILLLPCFLLLLFSCEKNTVEPQEDIRDPFIGDFRFISQDGYNPAGGNATGYQNDIEWDGTITKGTDINVLVFTDENQVTKEFTVDESGNLTSLNGRASGSIEPWGDYYFKSSSYSPVGYYYNSLTGIRQ